jgi:hypothetical protein
MPRPPIIRPTIICGREKAVAWMTPPTVRKLHPRAIDFRLPNMSPRNMLRSAPNMHPKVYVETICPCIVVLGLSKVVRKSGFASRPPKTP